MNLTLLL